MPFEDAEPKFLECCIESGGETLVVVVRYVGDRDDVDVDAVSLVEWAGSAGQLRDGAQIRALLSRMSMSAVGRIRP